MKKVLLAVVVLALVGCDSEPQAVDITPQIQQQLQQQQQPQVVYQQAPQPVVIQQAAPQPHYDSTGHLITGAALGYMAGKMGSNNNSGSSQRTVVNKNVTINKVYNNRPTTAFRNPPPAPKPYYGSSSKRSFTSSNSSRSRSFSSVRSGRRR